MNNFWRSMQFARAYWRRLALSITCGAVVAVFWGANITALQPMLQVLLANRTLLEYVDERIAHENGQIAEIGEQIDEATANHLAEPSARHAAQLRHRHAQLEVRQGTLATLEWVRPTLAEYAPSSPFRTLLALVGLLTVSLLLKSLFDFLQEYLCGSVVHLTVFRLRNTFYRKTMALDLSYFSDQGTHDFMARFTSDVDSLSSGLRALLGKVILEPMKAVVCLALALWISWRLTLVAFVLFPLVVVAMGMIGHYLRKVSRRNLESMSRIYKILQESFQGFRVVKAFNMEAYERRRFFRETKRYYFQSMKLIRTEAIGGPVLEFAAVTAIFLTLLAGAYLVMTGKTHVWGVRLTWDPLEIPTLLTLFALIGGICDPLRKVFSVYGRLQRGVAASDRIFQAMDSAPRVRQAESAVTVVPHRQQIRYENVGFGYQPGRPVLQDINLTIPFGETLAVVGTTGCGKTSLINLLPRFYDPQQGRITIDGVDTAAATFRSLRQQMGIVTQHTVLFDDTILNNIAYGSAGDVSAERVREAAKSAYAHNFIEKLPDGYATRIGEMGGTLSGGQRQRIALARAILRDPAILILDEATSSLDVESEALIHKALRKFAAGRTTLLVTHRLSTLDMADRILVVNAGRIEAVGTHDHLLTASETYRRLHDVQARGAAG